MQRGVETCAGTTATDGRRAVRVSVVLPCLDEAESVGACVREATEALRAGGLGGEVIVVDNGSTDGSPERAAGAGAVVIHEQHRGYGSALRAGFQAASGDVIVMADADRTYPLDRIPDLVAPIAAGTADLVIGSRLDAANRQTMPWLHRHVGTPLLTTLSARAAGGHVVRDSQSGFRAFRSDAIPALALSSSGMELASEMLIRGARAGLRITEIPTGYRERVGESKLSTFGDGWRHLRLILLLAPDLLLVGPGLTLFAFGVLMTILGFTRPSGVDVGSLRWQPLFLSGIALVLGVQATLAGAVVAHRSMVASPGVGRRFAFVGRAEFPGRCVAVGIALGVIGFGIDLALFVRWLGGEPSPPVSGTGYASLAQSLIIIASTFVTVGVISQFQRATEVRRRIAARDRAEWERQHRGSGQRSAGADPVHDDPLG